MPGNVRVFADWSRWRGWKSPLASLPPTANPDVGTAVPVAAKRGASVLLSYSPWTVIPVYMSAMVVSFVPLSSEGKLKKPFLELTHYNGRVCSSQAKEA